MPSKVLDNGKLVQLEEVTQEVVEQSETSEDTTAPDTYFQSMAEYLVNVA